MPSPKVKLNTEIENLRRHTIYFGEFKLTPSGSAMASEKEGYADLKSDPIRVVVGPPATDGVGFVAPHKVVLSPEVWSGLRELYASDLDHYLETGVLIYRDVTRKAA